MQTDQQYSSQDVKIIRYSYLVSNASLIHTLRNVKQIFCRQYFVEIKKDGPSYINTSLPSRACVTSRDLLSGCHRVRVSDLAEIRITHRDKRSGRAARHPFTSDNICWNTHNARTSCVFFFFLTSKARQDGPASFAGAEKVTSKLAQHFSSNQSARNVLVESGRQFELPVGTRWHRFQSVHLT